MRETLAARIWRRIVRGKINAGRSRRYYTSWALGAAAIWGLAIAYLVLTPKSYTSSFTFVLPGSGAGSSLNLDSVGQATSTTDSAFSTPDISPTENYREILLSHRVLNAAAQAAGLPEGSRFPTPKIELVQQTKLITVSVTARQPAKAQAMAADLSQAFLATLDALRAGEMQVRDDASVNMMDADRATLEDARTQLINYQVESGLVSLTQYNDMVAAVETLRSQLRNVQAQAAQSQAGVDGLTKLLNITPDEANKAMLLEADPLFQASLAEYAKDTVAIATVIATRGNNDPSLQDLRAQRASVQAQLLARSNILIGQSSTALFKDPNLNLRDDRAQLFERLVGAEADLQAFNGMAARLQSQIDAQQQRIVALAPAAAKLDELQTNVQVAEAVFASGLARIGTNKADFFASYPLVQTLEAPTLPDKPSSPQKLVGIGGAIAGTIFLTLALVMIWLRTHLLQKILKNELSTLR